MRSTDHYLICIISQIQSPESVSGLYQFIVDIQRRGAHEAGQISQDLQADQAAHRGQWGLRQRQGDIKRQSRPGIGGSKAGIAFGNRETRVEVLAVQENVRKEAAAELFKYLPALPAQDEQWECNSELFINSSDGALTTSEEQG